MIAWLHEYAKKHSRVNSSYQMDSGLEAFMRAFVTHWNAVTTAKKRTMKMTDGDGRKTEQRLKEDLEKNVTMCLHNIFCTNQ